MATHCIEARFREDVVLALCNAAGAFTVHEGMVPFRYQPGGKLYRTRPDRLAAVDGASPVAVEVVAASVKPPARKKGGASGGGGRPGQPVVGREARPVTDVVQLWTDGACTGNPGPSGSGVVYRHGTALREKAIPLGHGTNNIAELTAILEGLKMVAEPATTPTDVMTDSAYCVGLLTKNWKAKKNQELIAELRKVASAFGDLRIVKVKAHCGIPDNERADELACAGARGESLG